MHNFYIEALTVVVVSVLLLILAIHQSRPKLLKIRIIVSALVLVFILYWINLGTQNLFIQKYGQSLVGLIIVIWAIFVQYKIFAKQNKTNFFLKWFIGSLVVFGSMLLLFIYFLQR